MNQPARRIRFGAFELDPLSGDIWRDGQCRTLAEQPLAVLKALLQQPGEVVRREDLCRLLWTHGTFVDFEHGLNAVVKRLRDVLGDDADNPQYIETIPRRGYRLVAAVVRPDDLPHSEPAPPPPPRQAPWRAAAPTAALVVVLGVGAVALRTWHRGGPENVEASRSVPAPHQLTQVTYDAGWSTQPAVSPDGQLVAYASDRGGGGNLSIWVQRLDGGAPRRLTHGASNDHEPAFSPDGSRIVFRSERDGGGLYTIPAHSGGREERLVAGGHDPRFSPDGRFIAYWTGSLQPDTCDPKQNRVFIVPSEGGTPTPIATQFVGACWPVWAPDSRHVLVTTQRNASEKIRWLVVGIDGRAAADTGLAELAERQQFFNCIPRPHLWVRDRLVFGVWRDGPMNLWETSIDPGTFRVGNTVEQLTTGPEHQVAVSVTAGGHLVLSSHAHKVGLWSLPIAADAGTVRAAPRRLTPGVQLDRAPTVSLDGTVAFMRLEGEMDGICLLDARSGAPKTKVPPGEAIGYPSISPDGSRIAFSHADSIEVVGAAGEPERVARGSGFSLSEGWSRDNERLLYIDHPTGEGRIFVLSLKTGERHLLAARAGHGLYQARFSPDGRWLSFIDYLGTHARIFVAPVPPSGATDPATWIAITPDGALDDKPRWSPDGRLLYFLSDRDGSKCIWAQKVDLKTRRPVGPNFVVYHSHDAHLSMSNVITQNVGFDVARDQLVFTMGERTGNIWKTTLLPQ